MRHTLAVEKRGSRWAIVAKQPVIQRTATGVRVRTGQLWGKATPDRVVARFDDEREAFFTMGKLEARLSNQ